MEMNTKEIDTCMCMKTKSSYSSTNVPSPLPLTREQILLLNDGSTELEHAPDMFNVDFKTFKEVMDKENILVWNEPDGTHVRLHGGDYDITMLISVAENTKKMYIVSGLDAFEDITRRLEREHKLTPGSYKLSYNKNFGEKNWDEVIETDRNWHEAVRFFKSKSYVMRLDLKKMPGADSPSASAPAE